MAIIFHIDADSLTLEDLSYFRDKVKQATKHEKEKAIRVLETAETIYELKLGKGIKK